MELIRGWRDQHRHLQAMSIDEILQLMRLCSIAQVRAELDQLKRENKQAYDEFQAFWERAFRQPK